MSINNNRFLQSTGATVMPPLVPQTNQVHHSKSDAASRNRRMLGLVEKKLHNKILAYENKGEPLPKVAVLLTAAKGGIAQAQFALFLLYRDGKNGVDQSYEQAIKWCIAAANQGYAKAQYKLPVTYLGGRGAHHTHEEAIEWLLEAAKEGFAYAQYHVGCAYRDGKGIEQSRKNAIQWLEKAVEKGFEGAEKALAEIQK